MSSNLKRNIHNAVIMNKIQISAFISENADTVLPILLWFHAWVLSCSVKQLSMIFL